jgi:hypothetical protein
MKKIFKIALIFCLAIPFSGQAQDDLLDMLEENQEPVTNYTIATFKNTRLVSGHSIETNGKGVLQFMIQHRFGTLNSGWRELWGLDNSTIRIGVEYGLTDHLNIGLARSSFLKTYDAMVKWRFLRQKSGAENFPFTATAVSSIYLDTTEWAEPERENFFSSRLSYHHALLLARKFGDKFSLQLMPTIVHDNLVDETQDMNTIFSMGAGTSIKLTGSVRLNLEYYYLLPDQIFSQELTNSFSIGFDIETGGHVFQFHITNSRGMTERLLIKNTNGRWEDGDIFFGFNISRVFNVGKKKIN